MKEGKERGRKKGKKEGERKEGREKGRKKENQETYIMTKILTEKQDSELESHFGFLLFIFWLISVFYSFCSKPIFYCKQEETVFLKGEVYHLALTSTLSISGSP
jgi:hypothetical protein